MDGNHKQLPLMGRRIWLVEDLAVHRMILSDVLSSAGAEVAAADSGSGFMRLLDQEPSPDLLLMDEQLPDASGIDLLRRLPKQIPMVLLSAGVDAATEARALAGGCARVLDKTLSMSSLVGVLATLLGMGQAASRSARPATPSPSQTLQARYMRFLAEQRLALSLAWRRDDQPKLRALAHRLCGTAVHFGLPDVGRRAGELLALRPSAQPYLVEAALEALDAAVGIALEAHYRGLASRNDNDNGRRQQSCAF